MFVFVEVEDGFVGRFCDVVVFVLARSDRRECFINLSFRISWPLGLCLFVFSEVLRNCGYVIDLNFAVRHG